MVLKRGHVDVFRRAFVETSFFFSVFRVPRVSAPLRRVSALAGLPSDFSVDGGRLYAGVC